MNHVRSAYLVCFRIDIRFQLSRCLPRIPYKRPRNLCGPDHPTADGKCSRPTSCHALAYCVLIMQSAVSLLCLGYLAYTRPDDAPFGPRSVRHLIWIRAALLATGLFLGYSSLQYLTLAEYFTLFCLSPLLTAWACWMFVGEPITRIQVLCCCTSALSSSNSQR